MSVVAPSRTIVLFAAASPEDVAARLPLSWTERLERKVRRAYYRAAWCFAGKFVADPYVYREHRYSNRGDEAIRLAIEDSIRSMPEAKTAEIRHVAWGRLDLQAFSGIDPSKTVLMIAGGGYYSFLANGDLHPRFLQEHELIRDLHCPVVSYGTGVIFNVAPGARDDLVPSKSAESVLRSHFQKVRYCSVRDEASRLLLRPYSQQKIDVAPDPVLHMTSLPVPHHKRRVLRVGVNAAFHSSYAANVLAGWIESLVQLLGKIRAYYDCEFVYFVHAEYEHCVVQMLRDRGIRVQVVDTEPRQLAAAYASLDVHICQMMHSSIMSLGAGVPTLIIAYDRKHVAFAEMMKQTEFCAFTGALSVEELFRKVQKLISGRDDLSAAILRRRQELAVQRDQTLAGLANALSGAPAA